MTRGMIERSPPGVPSSVTGGLRVHVVQGEQFVTDDPEAVLTTLLGSCVAACMRDPVAGVAFAYVTNDMGPRWQNPRNKALLASIYECLAA